MRFSALIASLILSIIFSGNGRCETKTALVKGEVKHINKTSANTSTVEVEVVHVYSGDKNLKGKTFQDSHRSGARSLSIAAFSPFTLNETGLWIIKENKNEYWPAFDPVLPIHYRCRKVENPRYDQVLMLAEAIEKTENARKEEQIPAIAGLMKDRTPEISMWAVKALGQSTDPSARRALDKYLNKSCLELPLATQIAYDEVQSGTKQEEWTASNVRLELLNSWVKGKADDFHATRILSRIDMADQRQELSNSNALDLTKKAAENKEWEWKYRRNAIFFVGLIARRGVDDEPAYAWLFDLIKNNPDLEVRQAAAYTLRNSISMRQGRVKELRTFVAQETNMDIKKALQEAIDKHQKGDRKP